ENNLEEDEIVVYRYSTQWELLDTAQAGADGDNLLYDVATKGFSIFAISVKEIETVSEVESAQQPIEEEVSQEEISSPTGEVIRESEMFEKESPKKSMGILILGISVVLLLGLFVGYWYYHNKN
ncbi:MAG: PGF-pre-PGF domain-containing protein, partial [Nanoarchaeota archaeon]